MAQFFKDIDTLAFSWRLGDFTNGHITRPIALGAEDAAAEVSIDIHGEDSAEVTIIQSALTTMENNSWQQTFAPLLTFMVLDDSTKNWDHPDAIAFAGFVNKLSNEIVPGCINVQLTNLSEYLKARIVGEVSTTVSDPNQSVTFTGATWTDVIVNIVARAFSADGVPADQPKPPQVLAALPSAPAGSLSKAIRITDATTYHAALTEVSETDAGNGLEWRFKARYTSSARNAVEWVLIVGTNAVPHIGEDTTIPLYLAENEIKFSGFQTTINSNELYSKLYIQSKAGDEEAGSGADFTAASVPASEFPILVERFFNPGVELTPEELSAQLSARLGFAAKIKYENGFTVEEKWDAAEWLNRVGNVLVINGLDGTISAGHSAIVRCVGISFTPGTGTVRVELMQLGPTYPRLPKDRVQELIPRDEYNSKPITMPTTGGGGTPTPTPTGGGFGVDGVIPPSGLFGSEGRNPWDAMPTRINAPTWTEFKEEEYTFDTFDGVWPLDPAASTASEGNRVYALDHISEAVATKFYSDGTPEIDHAGGLDRATGLPRSGAWQPIYIKKIPLLPNGSLGKLETVGLITPEQIATFAPTWEETSYYNGGYFRTGFFCSTWVAEGKLFVSFAFFYDHSALDVFGSLNDYGAYPWAMNSKRSCIYKTINAESGVLEGEWQNFQLPANYGVPTQGLTTRFGDSTIFTGTSECPEIHWKNEDLYAIDTKIANIEATTGYKISYPMIQLASPAPYALGIVPNENIWPWKRSNTGKSGGSAGFIKNFKDMSIEAKYINNAPFGINGKNFNRMNSVNRDGVLAVVSTDPGGFGIPYWKKLEVNEVPATGDFIAGTATGGSLDNGYGNPPLAVIQGWIVQSGWQYNTGKRVMTYKITDSGLQDGILSDNIAASLPFYKPNGPGLQVIDCSNENALASLDRNFWIGDTGTNPSARLISVSEFYSYNGRIYNFVLSGPNKITLRSARMIEG